MVEVIELGSLYFNGSPMPLGARYHGEQISFGNTAPEKAIPFVKWNGLYIADRCVCTNISWDDLNRCGFIFGHLVRIDGAFYLCRSLKVGAEEGVPNEWDAILDSLGEDNDLWHWKNRYFWGQEIPTSGALPRALRGYHSARCWNNGTASFRYASFGFRPVLEPLPPETLISDALVGRNIKIYGRGCSIAGRLVGCDDYDLELACADPLPDSCLWLKRAGDSVFINREVIDYFQEEQ